MTETIKKLLKGGEKLRDAGSGEKHRAEKLAKQLAKDIFLVVLFLSLSTVISLFLQRASFRSDNLLMVYMLGGLLDAMFSGCRSSSIFYAAGSVMVFNYMFTDPRMTLQVSDPRYLTTFVVMFATSLTVTTLIQRLKLVLKQTEERAHRTEILLETSRLLQQAEDSGQIAEQTIRQLAKLLTCSVYCITGQPRADMGPGEYYRSGEEAAPLSPGELSLAESVFTAEQESGTELERMPGARCLYLAVRSKKRVFAVIGIEVQEKFPTEFEKNVVLAILNESALAFEKEELHRKERETALQLQQEQLRANLLRAISHDLRTPLTSISGNADMLLSSYANLKESERQRIFHDIHEDSVWLINLVENLLSVTRIENGAMKITLQPEMAEDVLDACLAHMKRHLGDHKLEIRLKDDMLMARMDAKLIIQVLINLMDNAVRHTPPGSDIFLTVYGENSRVVFEVADSGDGIPDDRKEKIFDMFYSGEHSTSDGRRGMGMGLTLCRAIVEAHGSRLEVLDRMPRGTIFRFALEAEKIDIG